MKHEKFLLVLMGSIIVFSCTIVSHAVASRSPGVPAGMMIANGSDVTFMGFNISSDIPREDVDDLYKLATGLLGKLGGNGSIVLYSPNQLESSNITGDFLHSWAASNLQYFKYYFQINVLPTTSPAGYRIEIYMWDNDKNTAGTYMAGIEIPKQLPLMDLLGIMETGTHNIKIVTTANEATKVARMSFYYQESAGAQETYLASVEITGTLMQLVLMSFMN